MKSTTQQRGDEARDVRTVRREVEIHVGRTPVRKRVPAWIENDRNEDRLIRRRDIVGPTTGRRFASKPGHRFCRVNSRIDRPLLACYCSRISNSAAANVPSSIVPVTIAFFAALQRPAPCASTVEPVTR